MRKILFAAALVAPIIALGCPDARAWEPETTHGGLAEQAALGSRLHKRLVTLGFTNGLFEAMTIPPADAPSLMAALKLLSPTHGAVPDARGRQAALGWIAAGAALADIPAAHGANHFYDPDKKVGWSSPDRAITDALGDKVRQALGRAKLPERGIPAPDWVVAKQNPFNLEAFLAQYGKAVTAATPGERSRHMAAALIAAGAILHTLGDLGSPSRVRGDEAAHFQELGAGPDDLGSRFERIAALAYGRLGVPGPSRVVTRQRLRDFFTSADGGGLADKIAHSYFSPNTLPSTTRLEGDVRPKLARAQPALPTRLNLMAASRDEGTILRDATGVCLARYRVEHSVLSFSIDDECMLEQLAQIMPEVAAYERGLLDFLLRGDLTIAVGGEVVVSGKGLGPGTIELVVEDERGVRSKLATVQRPAGQEKKTEEIARVAAPAAGARVYAMYRGVDEHGEPIVAVGAAPLVAR